MKKLLFLTCALVTLLTAASAFADTVTYTGTVSPIVVDQPGEHTIILDGVVLPYEGSGIILQSPATKLTIILKDDTESTMEGYDSMQGASYCGGIYLNNAAGEVVIRCERAGEGHECDEHCGKLTLHTICTRYDAGMSGNITIAGGNLTFTWTDGRDAIIGSSYGNDMSGNINISGGNLTFENSNMGAYIGSGEFGEMSGSINISGGNLTFWNGSRGAAIGSGANGKMSGSIAISGGELTFEETGWGANIGSGELGEMGGDINISGSKLTFEETGWGANIGSGAHGDMNGAITISNSTLLFKNVGNGCAFIGARDDGAMSGTIDIANTSIVYRGADSGLCIKPFTVSNTTFQWYLEDSGSWIVGFSDGETACGQLNMQDFKTTISSATGSAISFADDAFIYLDRVDSEYWIKVTEGTSEDDDVPLAGSPYHTYTNLKPLLGGMPYVEFRPDYPPAETPTPAPTATPAVTPSPEPAVPQTGDSTDLTALVLLAVIGLLGLAVLRRQRRA